MIEVILLCVCWVLWKMGQHTHSGEAPPLLGGWLPIIGHSHKIFGNTTYFMKWVKETSALCARAGSVVSLDIGFKPYYFITDPKDALKVANVCVNKHFSYDFAKRWLGKGLVTASGPIWKRHRKLIAPAFSKQVLSGFQDDINNQARKLVDKLTHEVDGGRFDISVYLKEMAAENICLTAFGISATDNGFLKTYAEAIATMLQLIIQRFTTFWLHNDLIYELSSMRRKEDEVLKVINGLSDEIIKRKRAELKKKTEENQKTPVSDMKSKPLMDLLLELSEGDALSDQEIREEIDTIITAALDTTAWMLTYTLVYLGSYPDIQDKVYNEIEEVLGKTRDVDKYDLPKLVYMEIVVKEILRLHTTGTITLRTLENDTQIKNYTLKAGSHCIISMYGVHRDPCWGTDPEIFRPERWMEPGIQDNVFGGFSLGRRNCIGKPYAMMSLKSALCYLLRRYKVTANAEDLQFKLDFILKPVSGHFVSIEER